MWTIKQKSRNLNRWMAGFSGRKCLERVKRRKTQLVKIMRIYESCNRGIRRLGTDWDAAKMTRGWSPETLHWKLKTTKIFYLVHSGTMVNTDKL